MIMTLIECDNLTIGYGSTAVQTGLNIKIDKGDYYFIVGENGTGKSTLMRTILGFEKPLGGTITFSSELNKNAIGYLPQTNTAMKDFPATVEEIVLSGRQGHLGWLPFYSKADKKAAEDNMARLDILSMRHKSFCELSGGQQQRVLLARALCAAQSMLLMDEPVKGFDPKITQQMYDDIESLHRSGMTVIMISHDLAAAHRYATKTLQLKRERRTV
ncbi:MAG: ABC transporter ATP-binding protein [Spirochaetales bacterium]|nr:ABC transporter ATP-binding protein [Spirochaetales bacterium]MBR6061619.1 ABC transporter ATP-binding protein [Spirochaetales bacterium]